MSNLNIRNVKGESLQVNVIRYFKINGATYLIFSLNETDGGVEGEYTKLYVSKVTSANGVLVANTIADDVEWNFVKDTIKLIIKANRDNGILPVSDENPAILNGIQVLDQKVFKLNGTLVDMLGANIKIPEVVAPTTVETMITEPVVSDNSVLTVDESTATPVSDPFVLPSNDIIPEVKPFQINNVNLPESSINPSVPSFNVGVTGIEPVKLENETIEPVQNSNFNQEPLPTSFDASLSEFETTPAVQEQPTIDYKALYETQLQTNQNLEMQLNTYKQKIEQIKSMLN